VDADTENFQCESSEEDRIADSALKLMSLLLRESALAEFKCDRPVPGANADSLATASVKCGPNGSLMLRGSADADTVSFQCESGGDFDLKRMQSEHMVIPEQSPGVVGEAFTTDTGNKDVNMLEHMKKMKNERSRGEGGLVARACKEMAGMPGPKSGPRNIGGLKPKGRGLLPGLAGLAAGPVGGSTAKDGEAISETAAMVEPNLDVARKGGGQGELCRICDSACLARFPATPANVQVVRAPAGLEQLRAEAHGYRLGRARRRGCRDACALRAAAGPRQHASACTFGGPASRPRPVPAPAAGGQACSVYCAHAPAFLAAHATIGCGFLIFVYKRL